MKRSIDALERAGGEIAQRPEIAERLRVTRVESHRQRSISDDVNELGTDAHGRGQIGVRNPIDPIAPRGEHLVAFTPRKTHDHPAFAAGCLEAVRGSMRDGMKVAH